MDEHSPLAAQKHLFAQEHGITYLNAASKSVLLQSTAKVGAAAAASKGQPWRIDEPGRYTQSEDIRARFASLIGATADDIALHPSVVYGVTTAANNLTASPGQRIIVIDGQFPSNVYAWRNLADRVGAEVITVARPDDDDWTTAILSTIDERTAICALPPCHWVDGTIVDLKRISATIKPLGAALVIDATQWTGAQPIDVADLNADFLMSAGYKWLLGPYGSSLFYAASKHHDGSPLEDHLYNRGGAASITSGSGYSDTYTPHARRYDAGQYLNLITLPMIQDALTQIQAWGQARIGGYLRTITDRIADGGGSLGLSVADAKFRSPHIVTIRHPDGFPPDIADRLMTRGIYVSARAGAVRISPHMFNDLADADRLLNAIEDEIKSS